MIDTDRLSLTKPTLADFDDAYAMSSDAEVAEFIGGKPASREDAWTKLLRNIGHWASYGYGIFTVREKASGAFVGEVGFAHFSRGLGETFDPFPEAAWVLATRMARGTRPRQSPVHTLGWIGTRILNVPSASSTPTIGLRSG